MKRDIYRRWRMQMYRRLACWTLGALNHRSYAYLERGN